MQNVVFIWNDLYSEAFLIHKKKLANIESMNHNGIVLAAKSAYLRVKQFESLICSENLDLDFNFTLCYGMFKVKHWKLKNKI